MARTFGGSWESFASAGRRMRPCGKPFCTPKVVGQTATEVFPPRTGKGGHHDDKRTVLWSDFLEYAAEFVHLRRGGVVLIIEGNQQSDYLTFGAFHGNAQLVTERRCQNIFVTREADATRRGLFGDLQLCDERGDEVSRSNVNMNSCPVKVPSCSFRNLLENDNLSDAPRIDKEERSRRAAIVGGNSQRLPGGVVWHCVQLKTGHLAGKRSVWVGWGLWWRGGNLIWFHM